MAAVGGECKNRILNRNIPNFRGIGGQTRGHYVLRMKSRIVLK